MGTFAAGAAIPVMSDTGLAHEPMLPWKDLLKSDDEELISELIKSNHDALAVIVDRYQQLVLTVARRIAGHSSHCVKAGGSAPAARGRLLGVVIQEKRVP